MVCAAPALILGLGSAAVAAAVAAATTEEGLVTEWLVCGPFPSGGMPVFYQDHLLEAGGQARIEPAEGMVVTNKGVDGGIQSWYGETVWERHQTEADGYVDLGARFAPAAG